jgi:hypothetical protein
MKYILLIVTLLYIQGCDNTEQNNNSVNNTQIAEMCSEMCSTIFSCVNKSHTNLKTDPIFHTPLSGTEVDCNLSCNAKTPMLQNDFLPSVMDCLRRSECSDYTGSYMNYFPYACVTVLPQQNLDVFKYALCMKKNEIIYPPETPMSENTCNEYLHYRSYPDQLLQYYKYEYSVSYYKCMVLEGGFDDEEKELECDMLTDGVIR